MQRRADWNRLKAYARSLDLKIVVLPPEAFSEKFDSDVISVFDPAGHRVYMNQARMADEDISLFSLAHEIGHALDHMSEPHHGREYGLHYHLAKVYQAFGRECPNESVGIFQASEDMANDLAESVLEELGIPISVEAREACIHH